MYDSSDVHDALNSTYENLVSAIEDFQQRGSGWILDKLIALDLHLLEFDPLRATSYIPLIYFSLLMLLLFHQGLWQIGRIAVFEC